MGLMFARTPPKIGGECTLPNRVTCRMIGVWNEDKSEWQTLQCGEKLYKALEEARAELKRKYPFCREPIVVLRASKGDGCTSQRTEVTFGISQPGVAVTIQE